MSINNPSQKSVVLESSVKPSLGLAEDSRNTDLFKVVGINLYYIFFQNMYATVQVSWPQENHVLMVSLPKYCILLIGFCLLCSWHCMLCCIQVFSWEINGSCHSQKLASEFWPRKSNPGLIRFIKCNLYSRTIHIHPVSIFDQTKTLKLPWTYY